MLGKRSDSWRKKALSGRDTQETYLNIFTSIFIFPNYILWIFIWVCRNLSSSHCTDDCLA